MRIHYYKQFFTGPSAPGPRQPRALVEALAQRGHDVYVIATDFNVYNEQDEPDESLALEGGGTVHIKRFSSPRHLRRSNLSRLSTYARFGVTAAQKGLQLPPPDVVVGSIQPIFTAHAALLVARRHRVPFVLEVRDIWPDALVVKGAVTGWKASVLHVMANLLYRQADRLVSLTPGIKKELVKKGWSSNKIDVFPNGFDPSIFQLEDGVREQVRSEMGWKDKFVALYAGTHTEVTAVDVSVRAAAELRHRSDIEINLVGSGQTKAAAMRLASELNLSNIRFHDPVPKHRVPELLAGADVALMTLFDSPLIHIYFENKFMDYLGSGKPIIAAMAGEQAEILRRQNVGTIVPTFDYKMMARAIETAADNITPFIERSARGKQLVERELLLPDIMTRYVNVIEATAGGRIDTHPTWEPAL